MSEAAPIKPTGISSAPSSITPRSENVSSNFGAMSATTIDPAPYAANKSATSACVRPS